MVNDKENQGAAAPHTACDICGREFCDSQTSLEDLAECYRLGFERLRQKLAVVEQVAEGRGRRLLEAEMALYAQKEQP